jgi:hypothetical protein
MCSSIQRILEEVNYIDILIMSESIKKRTLDAFFKPPPKKIRVLDNASGGEGQESVEANDHVRNY